LAQAAEKVGDLASGEALERYREALAQLDLAADKTGPEYREDYLRVARKLGMAQFHKGDRLAALATLSPALDLAENAVSKEPSNQTIRQVAESNLYVGEVLAHNGAEAAAEPKLRKAMDLYTGLTDSKVTASQNTSAGYEHALAQLALGAPADVREEIEAALAEFR
jgi:tetratricopeptide (TPR) repeat protein